MPLNESRRQQLDALLQRMTTEGAPDSEIAAVVSDFKSKYEGESAQTAPRAPVSGRGTAYNPEQPASEAAKGFVRGAASTAPAVGSMVGGTVGYAAGGPVGGVFGAGVGKMGGQSLMNGLYSLTGGGDSVPKTGREVFNQAVNAAGSGALEQAIGTSVPPALMKAGDAAERAGTRVLRGVFKIRPTTASEVLNPSFGKTWQERSSNAVRALHDEGYISAFGDKGSQRLNSDLARANDQLAYMAEQRAGQPVNVEPAIQAGYDTAGRQAAQVDNIGPLQTVRDQVERFLQSHGLAPRVTGTVTTPGATIPSVQGRFAARPAQVGAQIGSVPGSPGFSVPSASASVPMENGLGARTITLPSAYVPGSSGSPTPVDFTLPSGSIPSTTQNITVGGGTHSPLMGAPPPRTMPLDRLNATRAGEWAALRERMNLNEPVTSAELSTRRNINSALAAAQREAAPEMAAELDRVGRLSGLQVVDDQAGWRIGNREVGHLPTVASSGVAKTMMAMPGIPAGGKLVGTGLRNTGNALQNYAEQVPWNELVRAYILQALGQQ